MKQNRIFFSGNMAVIIGKKTGNSINTEVAIAAFNMAASIGYSMAVVGKCGPKTLFQTIRRAESHVLVGNLAQQLCDEFKKNDKYVVIRVKACKDDSHSGGPYMDIPLVETVQTLQDLSYRSLLRRNRCHYRCSTSGCLHLKQTDMKTLRNLRTGDMIFQ